MFCLPGRTRRNGSPASSTEIVASDAPGPRGAGDLPVRVPSTKPTPAGAPPSDAPETASMASSSAAEPSSRLSDRGTLATPDFVCGLKIQRLLGSIWCFVVSMGVFDLGLWGLLHSEEVVAGTQIHGAPDARAVRWRCLHPRSDPRLANPRGAVVRFSLSFFFMNLF